MLCRFKRCIKKATCLINYYYYGEKPILCEHHRELLDILHEYYHNSSKEEELKIRRMCLYLYNTSYADYGHCERAQVKICKYCHSIDYVDFLINEVNDNNICQICYDEKNKLEKMYEDKIKGWDASGQVLYKNKWVYIAF